jgi:hypothetical protein
LQFWTTRLQRALFNRIRKSQLKCGTPKWHSTVTSGGLTKNRTRNWQSTGDKPSLLFLDSAPNCSKTKWSKIPTGNW